MKYQALFSLKIKVKKSVVCCNFAWLLRVRTDVMIENSHLLCCSKTQICNLKTNNSPMQIILSAVIPLLSLDWKPILGTNSADTWVCSGSTLIAYRNFFHNTIHKFLNSYQLLA